MTDNFNQEDIDELMRLAMEAEGETFPQDFYEDSQIYSDDHTENVIDTPAFSPATAAVEMRVPSLGLRRTALSTEFIVSGADEAWEFSPKIPGTDDRYLVYKEGITVVAGKSGQGKSWCGMDLARRALDNDRPVLYFDFENAEKIVKRRMLQIGADPQQLGEDGNLYISLAAEYLNSVANVSAVEQFRAQLLAESLAIRPSLIVFDSMSHLRDQLANGASSNDEDAYIPIFRAVRSVISALGIPAVIIAHTPKGNDRTVRGSDAISNQSDTVVFVEATTAFTRDRDGVLSIFVGKDRHDITGKYMQTFRVAIKTKSTADPTKDLGAGPRQIVGSVSIDWDPSDDEVTGPNTSTTTLLTNALLKFCNGAEVSAPELRKVEGLSTLYKNKATRPKFDEFVEKLESVEGMTVEETAGGNNKTVKSFKFDGTQSELFEAAETAFEVKLGSVYEAIANTKDDPF